MLQAMQFWSCLAFLLFPINLLAEEITCRKEDELLHDIVDFAYPKERPSKLSLQAMSKEDFLRAIFDVSKDNPRAAFALSALKKEKVPMEVLNSRDSNYQKDCRTAIAYYDPTADKIVICQSSFGSLEIFVSAITHETIHVFQHHGIPLHAFLEFETNDLKLRNLKIVSKYEPNRKLLSKSKDYELAQRDGLVLRNSNNAEKTASIYHELDALLPYFWLHIRSTGIVFEPKKPESIDNKKFLDVLEKNLSASARAYFDRYYRKKFFHPSFSQDFADYLSDLSKRYSTLQQESSLDVRKALSRFTKSKYGIAATQREALATYCKEMQANIVSQLNEFEAARQHWRESRKFTQSFLTDDDRDFGKRYIAAKAENLEDALEKLTQNQLDGPYAKQALGPLVRFSDYPQIFNAENCRHFDELP